MLLRYRLSCRKFRDNAVRLKLHALAYNLANFIRTLALPKEVEHWSLTTLRRSGRGRRRQSNIAEIPSGLFGRAAKATDHIMRPRLEFVH